MADATALRQGLSVKTWLAMMVMAVVSACTVVPKGPPKTVEKPPEQPTGPVTPALPTDVARNRVALLVPMTGENAGVGESIANAANMAVLDTGGKTIRVTTYDTNLGAVAAAQKAIADGNKLILGPLLAEDVRAVASVGRAAKVPLISFSNDASVAGQGVWLLGFSPHQSISRVVSYAKAKGMTRFAGLVANGTYGQRASTSLIRAVEASGGQMITVATYDRTTVSMQAAVRKLAATTGYDAVLIGDSGRGAVQLVPLIRKSGGQTARILGTELWNNENALSQNSAMNGALFASVPDGVYNQLATKYRARFGKGSYRLSSLGYDSVLLVTKIAANWKAGSSFPVAQLSDADGFTGIDGAFRFPASGIAERALEVQQIGPGGFAIVSAAPRAFQ